MSTRELPQVDLENMPGRNRQRPDWAEETRWTTCRRWRTNCWARAATARAGAATRVAGAGAADRSGGASYAVDVTEVRWT
ncbi:hypothetical protein ACR6C2_25810 [Streptomyces sp. INA 01156]